MIFPLQRMRSGHSLVADSRNKFDVRDSITLLGKATLQATLVYCYVNQPQAKISRLHPKLLVRVRRFAVSVLVFVVRHLSDVQH